MTKNVNTVTIDHILINDGKRESESERLLKRKL